LRSTEPSKLKMNLNIIRMFVDIFNVTREKGNAYRSMVRRPEGKTSLVRYRHRWKNNIKMDP
jgi:hypothetical protein